MKVSSFTRLEDKVGLLLERLSQLKRENQRLKDQLAEKEREAQILGEQLAARDAERNEVKRRISGLVNRLEGL